MITICQLIVDAIFGCSFFMALFLLIIRISNFPETIIKMPILVRAANYTMLIGSLVYVVMFITGILKEIALADEYNRHYNIWNRLFGRLWIAIWLFTFLPNAILPQLLWSKKFRQNMAGLLAVTLTWGFIWEMRTVIPKYLFKKGIINWWWTEVINISNIPKEILIYLAVLSLTYVVLVLNKKKKDIQPISDL